MESSVSVTAKLFEFIAWFKANLKNVIIGAVIVIVVVTALSVFIYNRSQREVRASEALSEVRTPLSSVQAPLPGQAAAYLKVAQDYAGTKGAVRALLEAAGVYFVEGKYTDSEKIFQRVLKEYPESEWRAQATLGVAASLEELGKTNEAIAKYEEVRRNPAAAVADEAKLSVARLYEGQGKRVEALKMYDELLKAYPYSGLGMEAGVKLEDLTNRYPALATNLAPVIPPTPPALMMTNRTMMTNLQRMRTNMIRMTNLPAGTKPPAAAIPAPAAVPNPPPKPAAPTDSVK